MKKFAQNFKRFWSLQKYSTGGFTLVELIVVIAILAILAGIAVPAYSGYVEKANKTADQTLVSEVKQALELYYYSHPEVTSGYVILDQEGKTPASDAEGVGAAAMEAVYGENWQEAVALKYDGWKGVSSTLSYKETSYYGNETKLINTVDTLTTALGEVVEKDAALGNTLIGGNFQTFLDGYGVDTNNGKEVGNAAVLYVAQNTQGKETEIKDAVAAGISKGGSTPAAVAENIYNELVRTGIGDAAAMATIYAYAEGYAQATGQADNFKPDFSTVEGEDAAQDALAALAASFNTLEPSSFSTYVSGGQGTKDLQGYIDMMGTVYDNQDIISGNLSASDCFTDGTVENMLKGHATMSELSITTAGGQIAVVLTVGADGNVMTHVAPMNWDK